MLDLSQSAVTVYLHCLSAEMAEPLASALASAGCRLIHGRPEARLSLDAEMVFSSCESAILREALQLSGGRPVVAVSRLPDVSGWLDALEAGAADYIAAPFEPIQIRWLFTSHRAMARTDRGGSTAS